MVMIKIIIRCVCKFIGKSNERILGKLSKTEILRLYSVVYDMETVKKSNFTCQSYLSWLLHQYIFHLPSFSL